MIEVCVLGPVAARVGGETVVIASRAQRAVLAAVARDVGRAVPVDRLSAVVWSDDPPARALTSLRSHVSRLRSTLTADVIAGDRGGYALTLDCGQVDACDFDRRVEQAESVSDLDAALDLWRGEPFGEYTDHPFFAAESARLREVRARAREQRAAMLLDASRAGDALPDLQALVSEHPVRESGWILLLRALHGAGRQAEAVAAAGRYRQRMTDEGLEPSPAFVATEDDVFRTQQPAAPSPPRLPERLASIVGRDRELAELVGLLERRRLVTLVGPGGVGKTTLALEAARRIDLGDVWLVQLAEVGEDNSVIAALARATGASKTEPLDRSVAAFLTDRSGLVVLDNVEHVRRGAADAARLMTGAGEDVRVLATSRQALDVRGEVVVDVEPLARDAAVALFTERAADAGRPIADRDVAVAARICDRLDRLPLAIEMAAARVRGMALDTLAARLDDRLRLLRRDDTDPRHGTLWEVFDWSYELLDGDQRDLFEQLSVFAGDFTLDAAEDVCAISGHTDATLADLVDRSLVRFDPTAERYALLETVRQFAAERRGSEHPVCRRHVAHNVRFTERVGQGLRGADDIEWATRFDAEAADVEVAHGRARAAGDADAVARISAASYVLVYHRLRSDVGAWAEAGLALVRAAGHPLEPAVRAVVGLNMVQRDQPDAAAALLADLPDDPTARSAHEVLGDLFLYRGDLVRALDHARRAEDLARAADDHFLVTASLTTQALAHGYDGRREDGLAVAARGADAATGNPLLTAWFDYIEAELRADTEPGRALMLLDDVVEDATDAGWAFLQGVALVTASSLRAHHADPSDALRAFDRLIRHWRRLGDVTHQWTTLRNLVHLFVRVGAHGPAVMLLGAASQTPTPTYGAERCRLQVASEQLRDALGDARFDAGFTQGTRLRRSDAEALALETIATRP